MYSKSNPESGRTGSAATASTPRVVSGPAPTSRTPCRPAAGSTSRWSTTRTPEAASYPTGYVKIYKNGVLRDTDSLARLQHRPAQPATHRCGSAPATATATSRVPSATWLSTRASSRRRGSPRTTARCADLSAGGVRPGRRVRQSLGFAACWRARISRMLPTCRPGRPSRPRRCGSRRSGSACRTPTPPATGRSVSGIRGSIPRRTASRRTGSRRRRPRSPASSRRRSCRSLRSTHSSRCTPSFASYTRTSRRSTGPWAGRRPVALVADGLVDRDAVSFSKSTAPSYLMRAP